jgi:predicted RNA-binding Zn ribbon-like protein
LTLNQSTVDSFDLDSGALCLDFANTAEWHASDDPDDKLDNYNDLVAWAETAAILPVEQAHQLREMAARQPEKAQAAFDKAIELREIIYRLFAAYAEQKTFSEADLAALNKVLSEAMSKVLVLPATAGFGWGWAANGQSLEEILWPVARSAGELLTSDQLERVRQCADDRGCGYLFVDTSRNRSRRWCSMESCGNRAKAHRHYKKQKQAN